MGLYVINSIVDIKKNKVEYEPGLEFNCIQGDSGASYKIIFHFRTCINPKTISGILTFVLPNGEEYVDSISFDKEGKTGYYKLKDELLLYAGDIDTALTFMDENRFTVYTYFKIHVKKRITEDEIDVDPNDPTYLLLQTLLTEVKNLETSIKAAEQIRVTNENLRIENENARQQAEELRQQAEEVRGQEWEQLKQEIIDKLANIRNGKDATINGYNAIELNVGAGLKMTHDGNIFTIDNTNLQWNTF